MTLAEFATSCESHSPAGWVLTAARVDSDTLYGTFTVDGSTVEIGVPSYNPDSIAPSIDAALRKRAMGTFEVGESLRIKGTTAVGTVTKNDGKVLTMTLDVPVDAVTVLEATGKVAEVGPAEVIR